ncbi:MAG: YceI family protein [Proteobacteria bacterium]|nr:YceI family protein [Pseudomonadota bacterium]
MSFDHDTTNATRECLAVAVQGSRCDDAARARRLQIDPERTVVTVFVRRAGPLAKLGHDHVITSAGRSRLGLARHTPADSSFELTLPVDRLEVDLPAARAAAGMEFAASGPDDARAGTRHNMLRAEVLDAEHFPAITLRSSAASGAWPQPIVRVAVTLKGVEREQEIPVVVELDADGLTARGELRLNQTDFGITPFSVAGGAIRVADTLEIRFEIAAASPGAISLPRVP